MSVFKANPIWHVIDAKGQIVGRLAAQIAPILQGKHKPIYSRHIDTGDYVVVLNAKDVVFTGQKWQKKLYRWHTGYPGGLKQLTAQQKLERAPEDILRKAVSGMLPKNKLRASYEKKLRCVSVTNGPVPKRNKLSLT